MQEFLKKRSDFMVKVDVGDSDFNKEVIEKSSEVPVLVDFWAAWCGPCKMLGPTLEKIAEEYGGKFILAKVDVESNQDLSQQFSVMSIPAVKLFKDGEVVDEFVGALPESAVKDFLEKNGISK